MGRSSMDNWSAHLLQSQNSAPAVAPLRGLFSRGSQRIRKTPGVKRAGQVVHGVGVAPLSWGRPFNSGAAGWFLTVRAASLDHLVAEALGTIGGIKLEPRCPQKERVIILGALLTASVVFSLAHARPAPSSGIREPQHSSDCPRFG